MNQAKIIAVTQPFIENENGEKMTADEFIAYCARVSNPSNQINSMTANKLIKYCAKNKHWSVFEIVNVVMEINTTRDIARQILRHRSFTFQEFSQRYADPTKDLGFKVREARLQDTKNRQNSIKVEDKQLHYDWLDKQAEMIAKAQETYWWATENGIAKEQARAVLPEGLTVSRLYMAGSVRSWIHYIIIRAGKETQKEHREIAIKCWHEITKIYPSLVDLIEI